MWWSEIPRRRAAGLALLGGLLSLAGCSFRPIHGGSLGGKVNDRLAAIEVAGIGGRFGTGFRNDLLRELNPDGLSLEPTHTLEVRLRRESSELAIQLDDTATRKNLIVAASFSLKRNSDGQEIYRSAVRRVASFNVRSEPFANMVAEQDAARRAGREVARQIRTMLALYFAEQAA